MSIDTFKTILNNGELTDDQVSVLLERAKKLAVNQRYWKKDDNPTQYELAQFYDRYEYEIYDIGKAISDSDDRDGLTQYTELGITRVWGDNGKSSIDKAVGSIPPKTYTL